ncbi:ARL14 effector protein-like [Trichonephila inaurata madagascariensis]|uniref:ARL14 effector protein-like n=1 Tax=Trichonephila inaurata madagascariensis TaxID=2747483 RepID=A0A8X7C108_9ARAC|nr:ARL14 effector protein-like [Trichonephila inaurata madagascariensis]
MASTSTYGSMTLRERTTEKPKESKEEPDLNRHVSERELKKIEKLESKAPRRKRNKYPRKYNSQGIHIASGIDLCDCLEVECEGCYTPCPKCSSEKCGTECRQNRRWEYEAYKIEGSDIVVSNPTMKWKEGEAQKLKFENFYD